MKKHLGKRVIHDAVSTFEHRRPLYAEYGAKLTELFRELLGQEGIAYQAIEHRAKSSESLREKLRRPAKAYRNGLQDITDLCGLRIVTYTLADVRHVCDLIQREFRVLPQHTVDKGALLGPAEFGYRSRHFVVELAGSRSDLVEWKRFAGLRAEMQVRTVLEHAWAAIDHSLRYKRDSDVPQEQKRVLFRLSALLELADESFDRLKLQQAALRGDAERKLGDHVDETVELNSLSYPVYAQSAAVLSELMDIALAAGLLDGRDQERAEESMGEVDPSRSELITVARAQAIQTIHDLDRVLREEKELALPYFEDLAKGSERWHVTPTFVALLCLLRADRTITRAQLLGFEWSDEIADRVLAVAAAHRIGQGNKK